MIKGKYRYVRYLNDGIYEYQCLSCKTFIYHVGNFCSECGIKFTEEHKCRPYNTPRYEYENPNLDFNRSPKEVAKFKIFNISFKGAKDALEYAREYSLLYKESCKITYGPLTDSSGCYKIKIVDEWSKQEVLIHSKLLQKGYKQEYKSCYIGPYGEREFVYDWDDYYDLFPEEKEQTQEYS